MRTKERLKERKKGGWNLAVTVSVVVTGCWFCVGVGVCLGATEPQ